MGYDTDLSRTYHVRPNSSQLYKEFMEKRAQELMVSFQYKHLPEFLQNVSKGFCDLAEQMNKAMPDCEEKVEGLRRLLEAKDCFVRVELARRKDR